MKMYTGEVDYRRPYSKRVALMNSTAKAFIWDIRWDTRKIPIRKAKVLPRISRFYPEAYYEVYIVISYQTKYKSTINQARVRYFKTHSDAIRWAARSVKRYNKKIDWDNGS